MENMPYIATLIPAITDAEPIIKDAANYLRTSGSVALKDLIDFMLKDTGFNDDEKSIAAGVQRNIEEVARDTTRFFLGIQLRDDKGNFRSNLPPGSIRTKDFLLETALAEPLFERYSAEGGKEYVGLNMVTSVVQVAGMLNYQHS